MRHRILLLALVVLTGAAACSAPGPTEPSGSLPATPIPDGEP